MSYEILRSEGEGCFHQEQSGDYTVAVFKQTTNKTLHASALKVSMVSLSYSTLITRKLNDNVTYNFQYMPLLSLSSCRDKCTSYVLLQ